MLKYLFIVLLFPLCSYAGDYQLKLHITHLPEDATPMLLRVYNGNAFIVDSIAVRDSSTLTFRIPSHTPHGLFRTILGIPPYAQFTNSQPVSLDVLFTGENIEISADYQNPAGTAKVLESEENRIYYDFIQKDLLFFKKLGLLEQTVMNYPEHDGFYLKSLEFYRKFQQERSKLIDKTYASHRNTLAGRIIKNQKLPFTADQMTNAERDSIFRTRFLDQIDFNDTTLLYTNVYTDKVFQYIQMHMKREAGLRENEANCIRALDRLIPRLEINPAIQQHLLQFLINGFESMQMEEVLAHISANYIQQCGSSRELIQRRLEGYRKMAVGQKVPDFTILDINNNPVNLYSRMEPYQLILFWHTGCGHCQALLEKLPELIQKGLFQKHQVKIIGISIDENREEWLKYSATHPLDWVNTHIEGSFENPLAEEYNLFATPTMFLIDENDHIIAKPTTITELENDLSSLD